MIKLWRNMEAKVGTIGKLKTFFGGNPPETLGVCINVDGQYRHFILENGGVAILSTAVPDGLAMSEMDMFLEEYGESDKIASYKYEHSEKTQLEYSTGYFNEPLEIP